MKLKLENPVLIDSKDDFAFMIAEYIEIDYRLADIQISYFGKVYNYDEFTPESEREGQWVYDLSLNVCLTKDEQGKFNE